MSVLFIKCRQSSVSDSQTSYAGKSRQSCETGHACVNDGCFVGGSILSAL